MKEKVKGGQRRGAGRKPSVDPKQPVTIFVETSIIDSLGGKEGVQFLCYGAIYGEKKTGVVGPEFTAPQLPQPEPSFVATSSKRIVKKDSGLTSKAKKEIKNIKSTGPAAPAGALKPQGEPVSKFEQAISETAKSAILKQIAAIKAEKIPADRNTSLGRLSWGLDQQKRISELEKQLQ